MLIDLIQIKQLYRKLNPAHLALMGFVDRGLKNIIIFANQKDIGEMKAFYRVYDEQVNMKQIVNIVYNKSNFTFLISKDSAF